MPRGPESAWHESELCDLQIQRPVPKADSQEYKANGGKSLSPRLSTDELLKHIIAGRLAGAVDQHVLPCALVFVVPPNFWGATTTPKDWC